MLICHINRRLQLNANEFLSKIFKIKLEVQSINNFLINTNVSNMSKLLNRNEGDYREHIKRSPNLLTLLRTTI